MCFVYLTFIKAPKETMVYRINPLKCELKILFSIFKEIIIFITY